MMKQLKLWLPMPPSVNHYYGVNKHGQRYLNPKARSYRREAIFWAKKAIAEQKPEAHLSELLESCFFEKGEPLQMDITVYPPDHRRRDLDNLLKALLDALQAAGAFFDDCTIKDLRIAFAEVRHEGAVCVAMNGLDA